MYSDEQKLRGGKTCVCGAKHLNCMMAQLDEDCLRDSAPEGTAFDLQICTQHVSAHNIQTPTSNLL